MEFVLGMLGGITQKDSDATRNFAQRHRRPSAPKLFGNDGIGAPLETHVLPLDGSIVPFCMKCGTGPMSPLTIRSKYEDVQLIAPAKRGQRRGGF
jgi:hypothetical protein